MVIRFFRHQATMQTSVRLLLIAALEVNFSEILFKMRQYPYNKTSWEMLSAKLEPFCRDLYMCDLKIANVSGNFLFAQYKPINMNSP